MTKRGTSPTDPGRREKAAALRERERKAERRRGALIIGSAAGVSLVLLGWVTIAVMNAQREQDELADAGGVGLALHRLHHRADDRAGGLDLAVADLREHVGLRGQGGVDRRIDRTSARAPVDSGLGTTEGVYETTVSKRGWSA